MRKRLNFDDVVIANSQVVYLKKPFDRESWLQLAKSFPNIITSEHEIQYLDELDSFSVQYKTISKHFMPEVPIARRWLLLGKDYPNLAKLARAMLVLPYSTALVESTFSEFKAFKTCYRNRLSVENLESSILAEQHFQKEGLRVLTDMIERYHVMRQTKTQKQDPIDENSHETQMSGLAQKKEENSIHKKVPSPSTMAIMFSFWQTQQVYLQNKNTAQLLAQQSPEDKFNLILDTESPQYSFYDCHSLKRKPDSPLLRNNYKSETRES